MTTPNPYQAPSADISNTNTETYQPKIFTRQGRIGRMRYMAYCLATYLILIPFAIVAAIISSVMGTSSEVASQISIAIIFIAYIPMIIFFFIVAKRRFNDMDKSGWFSLLMLIPIANIFVAIWLLFGKGTQGNNSFGVPPCKNSTGVLIAAWFMIIIPVIGILAAVSLPAYQDYVERAQQYESLNQ